MSIHPCYLKGNKQVANPTSQLWQYAKPIQPRYGISGKFRSPLEFEAKL